MIGHAEKGWGAVIMTNGVNGSNMYFEILYSLAEAYDFLPPLRTITYWVI